MGEYGRGVDADVGAKEDTCSRMANSSVAFVSLYMLFRRALERVPL